MAEQPLLERATQYPLLLNVGSEQLFRASIAHVVSHERAEAMQAASSDDDFWPTDPNDWRASYRPYNVRNGVLQIPVMGVLLNRFGYQVGRWATGYKYLEMARKRGLADPNVRAIAYIHDSPGGEVAGCFEEVDAIFASRGEKPIRAFAADHSYSASYALASAADTIVVTRSGGVGSIGVVTAHVDYSDMLKAEGIKVTFIFAGKHKVDGNPYEKLPDSVKSRLQERIDRIYGVFTSTVARNRKMEEKAVRGTEALTYDAEPAVEAKLADRIGALEDEMAIYTDEVAEAKDENMANENVDKAAHDAAVAAATTAGMAAQKDRIKAILGCEEAKNRPKAAHSCAMNTDLPLDAARAFLKDLPEEKAETPAPAAAATPAPAATTAATGETPFEKAMAQTENPNVGASGKKDDRGDDAKASDTILGDYYGATGKTPKKAA